MQTFLQDFRYALRMLRKNLGLTIVIVLSLAIGIGANSAVFSVVDALLLRPLPYPQPERLAAIWLHSPGIGIYRDWPSPGQYIDIQNENHSFDEMSISRLTYFTLRSAGRHMAALAGHRHLSRLAVPRPVHRYPERKPFVRRNVHLATHLLYAQIGWPPYGCTRRASASIATGRPQASTSISRTKTIRSTKCPSRDSPTLR